MLSSSQSAATAYTVVQYHNRVKPRTSRYFSIPNSRRFTERTAMLERRMNARPDHILSASSVPSGIGSIRSPSFAAS